MPGDRPSKRHDELQAELNRQALVEIGKRLAELEKKFWDLESELKNLKYASDKLLATAKRLQGATAPIVERIKLAKVKKTDPRQD
jgi:ABC-type phosphate transport system auxiliary subunit